VQDVGDSPFASKGKEKGVTIKANLLAKGLHDRKEELKKGTQPPT
jgi:hypothetical protein